MFVTEAEDRITFHFRAKPLSSTHLRQKDVAGGCNELQIISMSFQFLFSFFLHFCFSCLSLTLFMCPNAAYS